MKERLLIFDNYDSFTYNLVQLVEQCGVNDFVIAKNDKITLEEINAFDKILLSPGPGIPSEAGILCDLIRQFAPTKKILGICLGHQAIAECFGAKLIQMESTKHGIGSKTIITSSNEYLFEEVKDCFITGRYHSWVVSRKDFPHDILDITAIDTENTIMACKHKMFDVRGVQFHPESYITEYGLLMMRNWLR
jgi:anthranilate synthase component 2